jgi:outer membrane receptor protein involved in Fe transport
MKHFFLSILTSFLLSSVSHAQDDSALFSGMVVNAVDSPLIGAVVYWKGTQVATTTDVDGWFTLPRLDTTEGHLLNIQYVGYALTEVEILPEEERLKLIVQEDATLDDVVVETQDRSSFSSSINPINVEELGQGELRRAACCNLSESFENNATVNISFSDAVTGAKEIELLGLRGTYTQMMLENRPAFNRLGRVFGLEYIPGTFIESIQISKGASSVRSGTQGIAGQINTQLVKPSTSPLLFINLYVNSFGRTELNLQVNHRITERWSTGLLLHGDLSEARVNHNEDDFLDMPLKRQINAISRWLYQAPGWHVEANLQGIVDRRRGGQQPIVDPESNFPPSGGPFYEVNNDVRRVGLFGKIGYLNMPKDNQSLALIYDLNLHEHTGLFGDRSYRGEQNRVYGNLIFETGWLPSPHHLMLGATVEHLNVYERFEQVEIDRQEFWTTLQAEYDWTVELGNELGSSFTVLAGIQGLAINSNYTYLAVLPRLNLKFNVTDDLVFRASGGRGVRTANVLIENMRFMPSYRNFDLQEQIMPEDAWNYGLNAVWNFSVGRQYEGSLSVDAYRTQFMNQLVADIDSDPNYNNLQLYNLKGESYSNSFLVSFSQTFFKQLEWRLAYKYNDVKMMMGDVLHQVVLQPQHRALVHVSWATKKKNWSLGFTYNVIGRQRLPHLHPPYSSDLPAYRYAQESPTYGLAHAHVVKHFGDAWELYIGGENLGNYTQRAPIIGYRNPFDKAATAGSRFDASAIYAPVVERMVYLGVKYTVQGKQRFDPPSTCK